MATTYDPKKVKTLLNSAAAFRMHPGGELIEELAKQLGAVDEMISAANAATTDANNAANLARADLRVANDELKTAREAVAPLTAFTDALKEIAGGPKGKAKTAALTVLKTFGIELEAPAAPSTPPA